MLAGDIDSRWLGLERFAGWPQPVVFIAGNHEFDGRDLGTALPRAAAALRRLRLYPDAGTAQAWS